MQHWLAAKGVLRYLAGTIQTGISYGHVVAPLVGYCDADFAGDLDTRRSTTGYVFVLNGGAISCWRGEVSGVPGWLGHAVMMHLLHSAPAPLTSCVRV